MNGFQCPKCGGSAYMVGSRVNGEEKYLMMCPCGIEVEGTNLDMVIRSWKEIQSVFAAARWRMARKAV
ncbi:MAG: hypothetical protein PHO41_08330 [Eubacteriales bacterium]|nr:hypothetical protein [Eubacteriales bacterium]